MMGIPCEDPAFVYDDNKLVLDNNTVHASTLKKNINRLPYHFVRNRCVWDELRTAYFNTNLNLVYSLTKILPSGEKR